MTIWDELREALDFLRGARTWFVRYGDHGHEEECLRVIPFVARAIAQGRKLEAENLALGLEVEKLINIMQRCFDIARGASYVKGGVRDIQSLLGGALSTPFSTYQRGAELYRKLREAALGTYRVGPTALNKALAELDKWEAGK